MWNSVFVLWPACAPPPHPTLCVCVCVCAFCTVTCMCSPSPPHFVCVCVFVCVLFASTLSMLLQHGHVSMLCKSSSSSSSWWCFWFAVVVAVVFACCWPFSTWLRLLLTEVHLELWCSCLLVSWWLVSGAGVKELWYNAWLILVWPCVVDRTLRSKN